MFGRLFGRKSVPAQSRHMVLVRLNARLQPMDRGEVFEDPLSAALEKRSWGEVSGRRTKLTESGEVEYCDIEILVPETSEEIFQFIVAALEDLGAPRGSKLTASLPAVERPFGKAEGLAVYLNGSDLPDETYQSCDVNFVQQEFGRLLGTEGRVLSNWQGPTETALYMYGNSFNGIRDRLGDFLASYPLCQKCRVTQIA